MKHEKIFKREGGNRVKIVAEYIQGHRIKSYSFYVLTCEKRKRTWKGIVDSDCYSFRALSMSERAEYKKKKSLEVATKEEVNQTYLELWEKMKPELLEDIEKDG